MKKHRERIRFLCFDTVNTIEIYHEDRTPLMKSAALCSRFHKLFNRFDPESDMGRLAGSGGKPVPIAPETAEVLSKARYWNGQTEGAFNIAAGTLNALWGFGGHPAVPEPHISAACAAAVRAAEITVSGGTAVCPPGIVPDLGGIAKGYAADRIAALLRGEGVACGLIDLGGNLLAVGGKPDGSPWRFGIRSPFSPGALCAVITEDTPVSVSTSGTYERYFWQGGRRYVHVMDPRLGAPIDNDLTAVSVISSDSTAADALSTAFLCLGEEKGLSLLSQLPGTQALFIYRNGSYLWSGAESQLCWEPT